MINFLSNWVKNLSMALIIVSILEMLLPNNKIKKYVKLIMGVYIVFNIFSPFLEGGNLINLNNLAKNINSTFEETYSAIDETSINKKIENLYSEELRKDIIEKLSGQGFTIKRCEVSAKIGENESKIEKITIKTQNVIAQQDADKIAEFIKNEYGVEGACLKIN